MECDWVPISGTFICANCGKRSDRKICPFKTMTEDAST